MEFYHAGRFVALTGINAAGEEVRIGRVELPGLGTVDLKDTERQTTFAAARDQHVNGAPDPMILLIDSTVWIDFFGGRKSAQTDTLKQAVQDGHEICVCGCVWLEVLQGIRHEKEYLAVKRHFENLTYLEDDRIPFVEKPLAAL